MNHEFQEPKVTEINIRRQENTPDDFIEGLGGFTLELVENLAEIIPFPVKKEPEFPEAA